MSLDGGAPDWPSRDYLRQRSTVDRLSDTISRFAGSIFSIIGHIVAVAAWITVNSGAVPGIAPFDPYPFGLLALIVTVSLWIGFYFLFAKLLRLELYPGLLFGGL